MTLTEIIEQLESDIAKARDARCMTGMHVPYHGPFCSAAPSVLRDLDRLVKQLKTCLPPSPPPPRT